jgi:N-acetylmuramic acid 6-phosphate (MurNAc-6-P) etherase
MSRNFHSWARVEKSLLMKPFFKIDALTISFMESVTPAESITGSTATASSAKKLTFNHIVAIDFANKFLSNYTNLPFLAFR